MLNRKSMMQPEQISFNQFIKIIDTFRSQSKVLETYFDKEYEGCETRLNNLKRDKKGFLSINRIETIN